MIKRAQLNLGAGIFRISSPGVDLAAALDYQFLLKEDYFYGQVVETGFVSTPTSGITYTVNFVNNLGFVPMVIVWPYLQSQIVRPGVTYCRTSAGGNVFYTFDQPTNTQLLFNNPSSSNLDGFYYQVCRTPKG
jgi:hypothetical protein